MRADSKWHSEKQIDVSKQPSLENTGAHTTADSPGLLDWVAEAKTVGQTLAGGVKAGLQAAKYSAEDKVDGFKQISEQSINALSHKFGGADVFSKESIAALGPRENEQAKAYTWNWYCEQIGSAAPLIVTAALGSRLFGGAARSAELARPAIAASEDVAGRLTLSPLKTVLGQTQNLSLRPTPIGLSLAHSTMIGFGLGAIDPTDTEKDGNYWHSIAARGVKGVAGAISLAGMTAGTLGAKAVFRGETSFLNNVVIAGIGSMPGGAAGYVADSVLHGRKVSLNSREDLDRMIEGAVSAALVGGTLGIVSSTASGARERSHNKSELLERPGDKIQGSPREENGRQHTDTGGNSSVLSRLDHAEDKNVPSAPHNSVDNVVIKDKEETVDNQTSTWTRDSVIEAIKEKRSLKGADLRGLNLRGLNFDGVALQDTNFSGSDLRDVDFSKARFFGVAKFTGADLEGANLAGRHLYGADFKQAKNLKAVNFDEADLRGADFSGCDLRDVDFSKAQSLARAKFAGADLQDANFAGRTLLNADFKQAKNLKTVNFDGASLSNANFSGSDLRDVDFSNAKYLGHAKFEGADLKGANFAGRDLSCADFRQAKNFKTVNFDGAHLIDVDFSGSDLRDVDFSKAISLNYAKFEGADLDGANFAGRNLEAADFQHAKNLKTVNFDEANLSIANFSGSDLRDVDFSKAKSLNYAKFEGADLEGVNFAGRSLEAADFQQAKNLKTVNFDEANLFIANFSGSDLRDVDFSEVKSLHYAKFEGADLERTNFAGQDLFEISFAGAKNLQLAILDKHNLRTLGSASALEFFGGSGSENWKEYPDLPAFVKEPEKHSYLIRLANDYSFLLQNDIQQIARNSTRLPDEAWNLSPEDFIKQSRWSYAAELPGPLVEKLQAIQPPFKLWERVAANVAFKHSADHYQTVWNKFSDLRALGRDRFLEQHGSLEQQIAAFHPNAGTATVAAIKKGIEKSFSDDRANSGDRVNAANNAPSKKIFQTIKYLKLGEFETQLKSYSAREDLQRTWDSEPRYVLGLVSNFGTDSQQYLNRLQRVYVSNKLASIDKQLNDAPSPSSSDESANLKEISARLKEKPPRLSSAEQQSFFHDATYFLPVTEAKGRVRSSLADWLMKNAIYQHTEPERDAAGKAILGEDKKQKFTNTTRIRSGSELELIASNWDSLSNVERAFSHLELKNFIKSRTYLEQVHDGFAVQAAEAGVDKSVFRQYQTRFVASQDTPSPFPLEKIWQSDDGTLIGRFIPRNDARGIFLGKLTDCCQHPDGVGSKAAWYGQESPRAGFFVVADATTNKVVAQSLAWVSDTSGLVFDSLEGKGLGTGGGRDAGVAQIYNSAAKDLKESFHTITIGSGINAGNTEMLAKFWKQADGESLQAIPADLGYTDARDSQYLLAQNADATAPKITTTVVTAASGTDAAALQNIVEESYPQGWRNVAGEPDKLVLHVDNKVVGYAALDYVNREVTDFAVLKEHRNQSLVLGQTLLHIMKQRGGVWSGDFRSSASYKLLQYLAKHKHGDIEILEDTVEAGSMNGEDMHHIRFVPKINSAPAPLP